MHVFIIVTSVFACMLDVCVCVCVFVCVSSVLMCVTCDVCLWMQWHGQRRDVCCLDGSADVGVVHHTDMYMYISSH